MKFVAQSHALAAALALVSVVAGKTKAPLAHLVAGASKVLIGFSDGNVSIKVSVEADVTEPGQAAVSCDRLAELSSSFATKAPVSIHAGASGLQINCKNSRSRLDLLPLDDVPLPLSIGDDEISRTEIDGKKFPILFEPLAAADTEPTRFYLCGAFLHDTDAGLTTVSTNGTTLIKTALADHTLSHDRTCVVATKGCQIAARLHQQSKPGAVTIIRSARLIAFETPGWRFTTRLIDPGEKGYPAYENVIPEAAGNVIAVNRIDLLASLSRLSAVSTCIDMSALVTLAWAAPGPLSLCLTRQPGDGVDSLDAEAQGATSVVLSLPQLIGLLNEFRSARVSLETSGCDPVVIRGDGGKLALLVRSIGSFAEAKAA
jgi:DNA polymerase III subunit beta